VLEHGRRFYWINPDDRTIATPYVCRREPIRPREGESWTDGHIELEYARFPTAADTLVSVAFDPLEDCWLDGTGIHTPWEAWVDRQIAAREAAEAPLRADARAEAEREAARAQELARQQEELQARLARDADHRAQERAARHTDVAAPTGARPGHDPKTAPCPACHAMPAPRPDWPDWYMPPARVTEVWQCTRCGLVLGW
jgi:hypothetical protein